MKSITDADTHLNIIALSFACTILIFGVWPSAHAEIFGITLDKTCLSYLKNNLTSSCPTYKEIMALFPDTANSKISGDFGIRDGIYQRLPTNITNSFAWYQFGNNTQLFIDPPADIRTRINVIEIRANLKEFKLPKNTSFNAKDFSLTMGVGRWIDKYCNLAFVDASNWIFLTGDSLRLMDHNCDPAFTNFNSTKTTYLNKITHDISTSYKYKLEQWVKGIKDTCVTKTCFYTANQTRQP